MAYFLVFLSFLYLMLVRPSCCSTWLQPNALSLQQSLESCLPTGNEQLIEELQDLQRPELSENDEVHALLKCLMLDLGLWSEDEGFRAKRIAKLFVKHMMTTELIVVIEYCNDRYRNLADTSRWAFEAYRCATAGRIGDWVKNYVRGLYMAKRKQSAGKET